MNISSIISSLPKTSIEGKGDGWINLAVLGAAMKAEGIDFQRRGYLKLSDYLDSLGGFEFHEDRSNDVPVRYLRERVSITPSFRRRRIRTDATLMSWAYLGQMPQAMARLAELALSENWTSNPDHPYDILINYLNYTFVKLQNEKKILYSRDNEYAVFNTGLVDRRFLEIYGLFRKNTKQYGQEWYLVNFTVIGEGKAGKTINMFFPNPPKRAHYIKSISDVCYDSSQNLCIDYDHILIDRVNRLPVYFLEENGPESFDYTKLRSASCPMEDSYNELRELIRSDVRCMKRMMNRLDDAVRLAIAKTEWNHKTAVVSYYPTHDKMALLLPLSFGEYDRTDVALVLSKYEESGNYQGETILNLKMAYNNARLVERPESYWLKSESRKVEHGDEDE